jgi:hypothetical protein
MKAIYKYPLTVARDQEVWLREGAAILTVAYEGQDLRLWALCDQSREPEMRKVWVFGDGAPVPGSVYAEMYLTSVFHPGIGLTFHVFVEREVAV